MSPTSCSRPQSLYITKSPVVIQTQKKEEDISATISQKCYIAYIFLCMLLCQPRLHDHLSPWLSMTQQLCSLSNFWYSEWIFEWILVEYWFQHFTILVIETLYSRCLCPSLALWLHVFSALFSLACLSLIYVHSILLLSTYRQIKCPSTIYIHVSPNNKYYNN